LRLDLNGIAFRLGIQSEMALHAAGRQLKRQSTLNLRACAGKSQMGRLYRLLIQLGMSERDVAGTAWSAFRTALP